jgi:hypothetical protein
MALSRTGLAKAITEMKYGALLGCKAQVIRAGADAPPVSKCQDAGGALFQFQ